MNSFQLIRNAAGQLVLIRNGESHAGVVPVRAFPIAAPDECISLMGIEGHEHVWIEKLTDVSGDIQTLIREELAHREFTPVIRRIRSVSSFATPSSWQVETDRGDTELLLKAEDHIRRLSASALLITDGHGVSFLIRNTENLDAHSRKLLDRFL
ncbi:MAG: DUF1854 domain-containing protein [Gallionella sp.]|jgi:hypothetical protein